MVQYHSRLPQDRTHFPDERIDLSRYVADPVRLHSTFPGRDSMASIALQPEGSTLLQKIQLSVESRISPDSHVAASMTNFSNSFPELKEVECTG